MAEPQATAVDWDRPAPLRPDQLVIWLGLIVLLTLWHAGMVWVFGSGQVERSKSIAANAFLMPFAAFLPYLFLKGTAQRDRHLSRAASITPDFNVKRRRFRLHERLVLVMTALGCGGEYVGWLWLSRSPTTATWFALLAGVVSLLGATSYTNGLTWSNQLGKAADGLDVPRRDWSRPVAHG